MFSFSGKIYHGCFFLFVFFLFKVNKSIGVQKYVCEAPALSGNDLMQHYFPRPSSARGSGRLYAVGRNQPSALENYIWNVSNLQRESEEGKRRSLPVQILILEVMVI